MVSVDKLVSGKLTPIKLYDGSLGANESTTLAKSVTDYHQIIFEVIFGGSLILTISVIVDNRSNFSAVYYITDTMFIRIDIADNIIKIDKGTNTNFKLTKIFGYL